MPTREEKKQRTRRDLANSAVELFTTRGYDNVTMEEIATKVGVSRRTAFRYFPSKDDLIMEHPNQWLAVFNQSIDDHADQPLIPRITTASYSVADFIETDPAAVRQLFGLALTHPALAARYAASGFTWVERIAREILRDPTAPKRSYPEARMAAAATMGVINSVCEVWAASDQPMRPLLKTGLVYIERILSTEVPPETS